MCKKLISEGGRSKGGEEMRIKVNGKYYSNHLKRELLPACSEQYEGENYYFIQDGAPSHTANITQEYLKENFGRRFIRKDQWPPNSPDCNPLDYFFWNRDVKQKVYEGRRERFQNIDELKKRIRQVWKQSYDLGTLRKAIQQFWPRLKAVVKENGSPIKSHFG